MLSIARWCSPTAAENRCVQSTAGNATSKACFCNSNYCNVDDQASMNSGYVTAPSITAAPTTTSAASLTRTCAALVAALYLPKLLTCLAE